MVSFIVADVVVAFVSWDVFYDQNIPKYKALCVWPFPYQLSVWGALGSVSVNM